MLMETFTRKRRSDGMFNGELSLMRGGWRAHFCNQDMKLLMQLSESWGTRVGEEASMCIFRTEVGRDVRCRIASRQINTKQALAELHKTSISPLKPYKHLCKHLKKLKILLCYTSLFSKSLIFQIQLFWKKKSIFCPVTIVL